MPIIKFVNESEKIEYSTEQDVCSLLCYAFDPQKTIMNDDQFVGCKPFGFPFWYMRNPLAVHQFMEFNHKRQFKHWKDLAKHRVISFSKEENPLVATLKIIAERIVSFYANNGYIAAYKGNYEAFGKDGYYVIPKDQYELIQRVLKDDKEISSKTARAIKEKVEKIKESSNGRNFEDVIRPGEVDYAAVQQGKIHETLDKKSDQLSQTADNQKQRADERSDKKREQAQQEAAPSLQKAGKAAAEAAFISGGFQLAVGIYSKCKEGKKINEFTVDDWKDIGIDTAKAAAEGGISGFAIYSITNFTSISAGPAAAGVSLAFSVSELAYRKSTGAISDEEFKESCQMAALNAAVSAVGAAIGQELIPIPLLGAWIAPLLRPKVWNGSVTKASITHLQCPPTKCEK